MRQTLYLSEEFVSEAKKKAKEKGLSLSSYIRMIVLEYWSKEEKGEWFMDYELEVKEWFFYEEQLWLFEW